MSRHINFEDNIFIVNMKIRVIRDLMSLEADPELFLEKTLDDLSFINATLDLLTEILMDNKRYIERDKQFHNLAETEWKFQGVISKLAKEDTPFTPNFTPETLEKLEKIEIRSLERRNVLERLFATNPDKSAAEPVVSMDELSELLKELK